MKLQEGFIFNPNNMKLASRMGEHIYEYIDAIYVEELTHFQDCWIMYNERIHNYEVINFYTGEVMPTKMMDGVKVYKLPLTIDVDGNERLCCTGEEYYGCVPFSRMNEEVRIGSVPQWID